MAPANKAVFEAETIAIFQPLWVPDWRQVGGNRRTVFIDSTAAIRRSPSRPTFGHRDDGGLRPGPGPRQRCNYPLGPCS